MGLKEWFEEVGVDLNSTEDISNEALSFLSSCEEFSEEDKLYLNSIGYSDHDINDLILIMDEED